MSSQLIAYLVSSVGTKEVLFDQWREFMLATGRSRNTIRTYLSVISTIMVISGVEDPLKLTRRHVLTYLARPITPWSRLTYYTALTAWERWLKDFDVHPESDLLRGIPKPKRPDGIARPITDEEASRLLASPMNKKTRAYVCLALFQGLRVHEIAKIKAEDMDLAAGWLTVLGKGQTHQIIPLHPEVIAIAAKMPQAGVWFPHREGRGHVTSVAVSQTVAAALRRAGIDATAHQLRDTCATQLQRNVGDIRLTQSMLRHRNVQSTQKYTQVADQRLKDAVAGLHW